MLVLLLSTSQTNILRPATSILQKLIISSIQSNGEAAALRTPKARIKGKGKEKTTFPDSLHRYSFDQMFRQMGTMGLDEATGMRGVARIMAVLAKRLEGTGDLELVAQR